MLFYICHTFKAPRKQHILSLLKHNKYPNSYHIVITDHFCHICTGVKYIHNLKQERIPNCYCSPFLKKKKSDERFMKTANFGYCSWKKHDLAIWIDYMSFLEIIIIICCCSKHWNITQHQFLNPICRCFS